MLNSILLGAYQCITARKRRAIARKLTQYQNWPAAVLFYHRVADRDYRNGWSITSQGFKAHLDFLQANASVISLSSLQASQVSGQRSSLEVAITFDDGYADNCLFAIPEMMRRGIPCTYFVSTEPVETGRPFLHDQVFGNNFQPNTIGQIREMVDLGVEIGGHTATHPDLGKVTDRAKLRAEIVDSRKKLQDWTGQSIPFFSFPYGRPANITQAAIDVVWEAGYSGFLSANGGWNWPLGSDFHMERIHGDPGMNRLKNWLTLDPRKLKNSCSIQFEDPRYPERTKPSESVSSHSCDQTISCDQSMGISSLEHRS